jgi:hypothetical protein
MRGGTRRCRKNADLVGDGQVAHCPSTVRFLEAILVTDVLRSSRNVGHRPFCSWGPSRERDVEWVGGRERGMEEDEEGEGEEHGGRVDLFLGPANVFVGDSWQTCA